LIVRKEKEIIAKIKKIEKVVFSFLFKTLKNCFH